ncbi:hypothetical protein IG631_19031 [Alternaria alternata]|nr:hypothetical protein IG631_19031 [Alternaria alternata]
MESEGSFAQLSASLPACQLVLVADAHVRQGGQCSSIRTNASSENGAMHTQILLNAQYSAHAPSECIMCLVQ